MASDGAHVFFGGRPLTRKGKKDGGLSKDDKVGNVAFIEDNRNEIRQNQSDCLQTRTGRVIPDDNNQRRGQKD